MISRRLSYKAMRLRHRFVEPMFNDFPSGTGEMVGISFDAKSAL